MTTLHERFEWLIAETAKDNWDECGGSRIPREAWEGAEALVRTVSDELLWLRPAFPCPGGNGGINLRWADEYGRTFDAEIMPDLTIAWTERREGLRRKGTLAGATALITELRRFFE
jgi:hypothetical protein